MATLYNGNKVVALGSIKEIIKEVPTEQDLTLLGNQMRRAYAYTNVQEGSGKHQIAFWNDSSEMLYTSTDLYDDLQCVNTAVTIGGKAYIAAISNSQITLTQQGPYTDWNIYTSYTKGIRNNQYSGVNVTSYSIPATVQNIDSIIIINGILYNSGVIKDNGGVWTSIIDNSVGGIRDGYLTVIDSTYGTSIFSDFKVKDNLYKADIFKRYVLISDNLDVYYVTYSNGAFTSSKIRTLNKTPSKILSTGSSGGSTHAILYEDGTFELWNGSDYSVYATNDCKNVIIPSNGLAYFILKNDGNLYHYRFSNVSNPTIILKKSLGQNAEIFSYFDKLSYGEGNTFKISYTNTSPIYDTVYVPSIIGTNAYINVNTLSAKTITATTSTSITVDGREYIRDTSKDSVFNFVPPELANHQFTDQEMCQAYLSGGLQQNNS